MFVPSVFWRREGLCAMFLFLVVPRVAHPFPRAQTKKEISTVSMRPREVDCLAVLTHGGQTSWVQVEKEGSGDVLSSSRPISSNN